MSRRLNALVIGNAEYDQGDTLKNPINDAVDVKRKLEACGFTVILETNGGKAEMDRALRRFKRVLEDSDVGLFFFAGHGMQIDGENYLVAVDTDATDETSAKYSSLSLNHVIESMEKADCSTSIVILDACRNNPFGRAWARSVLARGLAPVYAPRGTLIAYATSPGQTASDGAGRNGAYTDALLQHLDTADCSIETMFKRVRNSLSAATGGRQISWEHTSLADEFYFNLSLGLRIDIYDKAALSDALFVLDDAKASHQVIRGLKSRDWYVQNPAVGRLTVALAEKASANSLFVLGRNLYQAACGDSKAAGSFLADFASRTTGLKEAKRKALLDGMLFEAFFDPQARLRRKFKLDAFAELFALQRHADLLPSFDFIAECLLPEVARFHAIPGKRQEVAVDVVTRAAAKENHHILVSVHYAGRDILWLEDADYQAEPGEPPMRDRMDAEDFEALLSRQMIVAPHLLKINYLSFRREGGERIYFPLGWTTAAR